MLILCLSFSIAVLDQVTKYLVWRNMALGVSIPVIHGFFNLTYVRNTGAAWGMLTGFNYLLVFMAIAMLVVLIVFRRHFISDSIVHHVAMGLMVAGIVGNLIDRLRLGYVIDFLDFYLGTYHWPAFNIADSAITVGTFWVAINLFFQRSSNT